MSIWDDLFTTRSKLKPFVKSRPQNMAQATRWYLGNKIVLFAVLFGSFATVDAQVGIGNVAFEVASVRRVSGMCGETSVENPGGTTFIARNATLKLLVGIAFAVDGTQIRSDIKWLDNTCYDIVAKTDTQERLPSPQFQAALRQLLIARFHLVTAWKSETLDGFSLIVSTSGARLKQSQVDVKEMSILPNGIRATSIDLDTLAGLLAIPLGKPVHNDTRLPGSFQIVLNYASPNSPNETELPSIYTALQEQLGLKLIKARVIRPLILVQTAEREPEGN